MGNIVDAIIRYFTDDKVSLSTKVKLMILGLLALILIDNHFGFSHTLVNSYKVDYMMKLAGAKQLYKKDTVFVAKIDQLIEIEHNRQGCVEKFCSLFYSKIDKKQQMQSEELYHKMLTERDPIIHTLTGACVTVFFMLFSIISIVINIFKCNESYLNIIFRAIIIFVVSACLTYYISLVWMLVEPIFGYLWLNYLLQTVVNIIIIYLITAHIVGSDHKEGKEQEEFEIP